MNYDEETIQKTLDSISEILINAANRIPSSSTDIILECYRKNKSFRKYWNKQLWLHRNEKENIYLNKIKPLLLHNIRYPRQCTKTPTNVL